MELRNNIDEIIEELENITWTIDNLDPTDDVSEKINKIIGKLTVIKEVI